MTMFGVCVFGVCSYQCVCISGLWVEKLTRQYQCLERSWSPVKFVTSSHLHHLNNSYQSKSRTIKHSCALPGTCHICQWRMISWVNKHDKLKKIYLALCEGYKLWKINYLISWQNVYILRVFEGCQHHHVDLIQQISQRLVLEATSTL